ncbi:MAG: hypothetical protein CVU18_07190 [Betaproteobacteria bacterium HGW-Betaproteobacteria-12]|nr:MAG: hypothetical protein CVU18_07190 [Betaproteobacteria bacterium HGW-Betaproteobacteria-12]
MQLPITIGLHRCRFCDALLISITVAATSALLSFPRAVQVQAGFLLAVWSLALWSWRRLVPTLSAIRLERDGQILVATADDPEFCRTTLLPRATVNSWLTVVRLQLTDGTRHTVLVGPGSMAAEDFRRLRVFLRWRADFSVPDGGP